MGRQGSPTLTVTPGRGRFPDVVGLGDEVEVEVELGLGLRVFVGVAPPEVVPPVGWLEVVVGAGVALVLVGAVAGVGIPPGVALPLGVGAPLGVAVDAAASVDGRALGEVEGTAVRAVSRETPWVSRDSPAVAALVGAATWSCIGRCGATYVPTRTAA